MRVGNVSDSLLTLTADQHPAHQPARRSGFADVRVVVVTERSVRPRASEATHEELRVMGW
jgi:hypothetical protein